MIKIWIINVARLFFLEFSCDFYFHRIFKSTVFKMLRNNFIFRWWNFSDFTQLFWTKLTGENYEWKCTTFPLHFPWFFIFLVRYSEIMNCFWWKKVNLPCNDSFISYWACHKTEVEIETYFDSMDRCLFNNKLYALWFSSEVFSIRLKFYKNLKVCKLKFVSKFMSPAC